MSAPTAMAAARPPSAPGWPERQLTALLRRSAIRHRLLAAFIVLTLLPLLVSGYISYTESSKAIQQKTQLFATEIVKQVAKNVQLQMAAIETGSEALALSDAVQQALARYDLDSATEKGRARADLTKILLDAYGARDDISQKYFLDPHNRVLDPQVFAQLGRGVEQFVAAAPAAAANQGRPSWAALDLWGGNPSIAMVRQIYWKRDNRLAGSLLLGVRPAHLATVFDNVHLGAGSEIFVLDSRDGSALIQPREHAGAMAAAAPALLRAIAASARGGEPTGFLAYPDRAAGAGYFVAYTQIPRTSWYVVSILPDGALLAEAQSVRNKIVSIGLLCFLVAIGLAYMIARSISAPLEKLACIMRETVTGNYALRMDYEGGDELALLSQKFNEMAANISQTTEQLEARVAARTRDLELANEKLAALSMTDSLTAIANRRRFDAALEAELHRAARSGQPVALLMIDVDFFKNYNDFYGHQEGDACLRKVAALLQAHARRASDLAARYGGEEFVMLAADTDADAALALAEALRLALEALRLPHAKSPIGCVSISVGVAVLTPNEHDTADLFIRSADKAMYRAKEQGRNRVVLGGRK
ncbi:diguanylate cyclase [Rugamonas sp.]|uniref:GGDEF domain-containing protein n=1 Tax=Rugamonas sp. TaxID=1926287 RepID=UPI0025FB1818|nr:diguanylate cyclase [Rugamonas sp.]